MTYPNIYIGHTTNFTKRKQHHKEATYSTTKSNKQYDRKLYKTIRDNGVWGDWKMIIIKDFPCETRREAESEEQKYMTEIGGTLNMIHSCRNQKQYREDNKEVIKEYQKQYNEDNKEHLSDYRSKYRADNKEKQKQWQQQHRVDNKEKIKEHRSKKYTCDCGITSRKEGKARHERSKGHIYRMLYIIDKKYSILLKQFEDIIKLQ